MRKLLKWQFVPLFLMFLSLASAQAGPSLVEIKSQAEAEAKSASQFCLKYRDFDDSRVDSPRAICLTKMSIRYLKRQIEVETATIQKLKDFPELAAIAQVSAQIAKNRIQQELKFGKTSFWSQITLERSVYAYRLAKSFQADSQRAVEEWNNFDPKQFLDE
jgi:hypothetical protein